MRAAALLLALAAVVGPAAASLQLQVCDTKSARQVWHLDIQGRLQLTSTGECVTTLSQAGAPSPQTPLFMSPCGSVDTYTQSWAFTGNGNIVSTANPSLCLRANGTVGPVQVVSVTLGPCQGAAGAMQAGSGASQGATEAASPAASAAHGFGWGVTAAGAAGDADCGLMCKWKMVGNGTLVNAAAKLCLDAPPALPVTCGAGSPSEEKVMCNNAESATTRVDYMLAQLSTAQQVDLVVVEGNAASTGSGAAGTDTGGASPFVEDLNLKGFSWGSYCVHGLDTVPGTPTVTTAPMPIALGATFDTDLVSSLAKAVGVEARVVANLTYAATGGRTWAGLACAGPVANIARDPRWGRVSETLGEDPYAASVLLSAWMHGLQRPSDADNSSFIAVAAIARHMGPFSGPLDGANASATLDNRTMADTYLPVMQALLAGDDDASVAGVLPSPMALNGVPASQDPWLLQSTLRTDFKSGALVVAEPGAVQGAYAQHHYAPSSLDSTVMAVKAGVHVIQDASPPEQTTNMLAALKMGRISEEDVSNMARHALLTRLRLGEFDGEGSGGLGPRNPFASVDRDDLDSPAHRALARQAAAASVVLLTNRDGTLPLNAWAPGTLRNIAVVGPNAVSGASNVDARNTYMHSYSGDASNVVSILEGVRGAAARTRPSPTVSYVPGCVSDASQGCFCCRPSQPEFTDAIGAAQEAQVTIAVLGLDATLEARGVDRANLQLPGVQAELVKAIQAGAPKTRVVIVLVNGGAIAPGSLLDAVSSSVEAWYGGEEAGNGVADVLWGEVNPSGRLPVTMYASEDQLPPIGNYYVDPTNAPPLGRTYRYWHPEQHVIKNAPAFFFGFGLSYTTFHYSDLVVTPLVQHAPCGPVTVSVNVTNAGRMSGNEVVQVYVYSPESHEPDDDARDASVSLRGAGGAAPSPLAGLPAPTRSLQGFEKVMLSKGRSATVKFTLSPAQLSIVLANGSRAVPYGRFMVAAGGHQLEDLRGSISSNALAEHFEIQPPPGHEGDAYMLLSHCNAARGAGARDATRVPVDARARVEHHDFADLPPVRSAPARAQPAAETS